MYVRFITPWWRVRRGVDCGLFGPAYACARDSEVPFVLREALWAEIEWFEQNLPVPTRFRVKSRAAAGLRTACAGSSTTRAR